VILFNSTDEYKPHLLTELENYSTSLISRFALPEYALQSVFIRSDQNISM